MSYEDVKKVWMNGRLVDFADAKIHAFSHVFHYGSAMFEGARLYKTRQGSAAFRIDEHIKNEAAAVLSAMGLTVSDAFRLMMMKIAKEKALPFEPLVPNEETIEAMKAARRGEVRLGSHSELGL